MNVLITGGGTVKPIDDVRAITNFSTGGTATDLASAFHASGHDTTLLLSHLARDPSPSCIFPVERFGPHTELMRQIEVRSKNRPDIIVHAAAVADYAPDPIQGKISSTAETLDLTLRRTPKIINSLRKWFPKGFLVGFKLLSGAEPEALLDAAMGLLEQANLNMVVANDFKDIQSGRHEFRVIDASGVRATIPRHAIGNLAQLIIDSA